MYCPQCGKKFWFRNTFCPDCRVGLVEHPPVTAPMSDEPAGEGSEQAESITQEPVAEDAAEEPTTDALSHTDPELTYVLTAYNPALAAIAESLLDAQGIEYMARGADPIGFPIGPGPVEFWVRGDEADRAREILQDLREASEKESSGRSENE